MASAKTSSAHIGVVFKNAGQTAQDLTAATFDSLPCLHHLSLMFLSLINFFLARVSLYADCDFCAKKFSSLRPYLPFCNPVATSAQLTLAHTSAVVQGVLQEPSETMNVRLRSNSSDISTIFELVLGRRSLHRL